MESQVDKPVMVQPLDAADYINLLEDADKARHSADDRDYDEKGLERESNRIALSVLGGKIQDSEEYLADLRRQQVTTITQATEARLEKYYVDNGIVNLLPMNAPGQAAPTSIINTQSEDAIRKATFNYNRLQKEIERMVEVLEELHAVRSALEDGGQLPT